MNAKKMRKRGNRKKANLLASEILTYRENG
jgi:hypothetical protein